jgi:hypothetical protein
MTRYRASITVGMLVVTGALGLTACSSSTTSASASRTGTSSNSATATPSKAGSNPGSSFCVSLADSQAKSAQLATAMTQAVASGSFATAKQALSSVLATIAQDLVKVEAQMTSVPSDVQAAITTVNNFFTQAQSAIANTTSMSELGQAIAGLDTPQLKAASATLTQYAASQCGVTTSATP